MTDHALRSETGRFDWKGFAPTIIIYGPEQGSGDIVTRVSAPGADSVARVTADGDVSLVIRGVEGVGRPGEARVVKQLQAWLRHQGMTVEFLPGTDDRGEDRRLKASDRSYTVQVVTVPADPQLWQDASRSSASAAMQLDSAVHWIDDAIQKKVSKTTGSDRKSTILVLDAHHANPLTELVVVKRYVEIKGDPHDRHGFAGVWIIGSSKAHCVRLGTSLV